MEGEFYFGNSYYLAKYHSAGIITEIKDGDEWLSEEMSWVSRSEIPFVTALRHSQMAQARLIEGNINPIIRQFGPFYEVKEVANFPSREECQQLVYRYCGYTNDASYHFYDHQVKEQEIRALTEAFDYENDLMIRAGSCLYKANILLDSSSVFAEEVYINTFIALEAILENLIASREKIDRSQAIDLIGDYLKIDNPGIDFEDHEEEMRDGIRNNIIHPYRRSGDLNPQPILMADYVYEDLSLVDWIFKKVIVGDIA